MSFGDRLYFPERGVLKVRVCLCHSRDQPVIPSQEMSGILLCAFAAWSLPIRRWTGRGAGASVLTVVNRAALDRGVRYRLSPCFLFCPEVKLQEPIANTIFNSFEELPSLFLDCMDHAPFYCPHLRLICPALPPLLWCPIPIPFSCCLIKT